VLHILVLQSRYFVADNVLDEVTFGWPRQKGNHHLRENLTLGLQRAINWVVMALYTTKCILIYIYICMYVCMYVCNFILFLLSFLCFFFLI